MTKKSKLIQNDPVTCARLFDHMVHLLINNFINDEDKPIGDVQDSFLRGLFPATRFSTHIKMHLYMVKTRIQKWLPLLENMFRVVMMFKREIH